MQYIYIPTKPGNTNRGDYVMQRLDDGSKPERAFKSDLPEPLLTTLRNRPFTWMEANGEEAKRQLALPR